MLGDSSRGLSFGATLLFLPERATQRCLPHSRTYAINTSDSKRFFFVICIYTSFTSCRCDCYLFLINSKNDIMSESEENRFDSILLALAEQHKNGVPEVKSTNSQFELKTNNIQLFDCRWFLLTALGHIGWFYGPKNGFLRWRQRQ